MKAVMTPPAVSILRQTCEPVFLRENVNKNLDLSEQQGSDIEKEQIIGLL